jgi:hypothetical protein
VYLPYTAQASWTTEVGKHGGAALLLCKSTQRKHHGCVLRALRLWVQPLRHAVALQLLCAVLIS